MKRAKEGLKKIDSLCVCGGGLQFTMQLLYITFSKSKYSIIKRLCQAK